MFVDQFCLLFFIFCLCSFTLELKKRKNASTLQSVYFPSCNSHTMSMLTLRQMSELQIDISINVNQMYYCWGLERVLLTWNCKKGRMKNESTSLHSVYFAPCCSHIMIMLRLRRTSELWLDLSMNVNHIYYCWGLERVLLT